MYVIPRVDIYCTFPQIALSSSKNEENMQTGRAKEREREKCSFLESLILVSVGLNNYVLYVLFSFLVVNSKPTWLFLFQKHCLSIPPITRKFNFIYQ